MDQVLTIGETATRSGVAASALRFYEELGLIRSERNPAGHRRYPRAVLRRIAFIVFAQKIGLTLDEVAAELAKLPQHRVPEGKDWSKLSGDRTRRIDERIAELERLTSWLYQAYWLRVPVAWRVPIRQSWGPDGALRPRPSVLGEQPTAQAMIPTDLTPAMTVPFETPNA